MISINILCLQFISASLLLLTHTDCQILSLHHWWWNFWWIFHILSVVHYTLKYSRIRTSWLCKHLMLRFISMEHPFTFSWEGLPTQMNFNFHNCRILPSTQIATLILLLSFSWFHSLTSSQNHFMSMKK